MAEKKKLTTAEILASARKRDGGGGSNASDEPAAADSSPTSEAEAVPPSSKAPSPKKLNPGERPSVADILAMARSGGSSESAEAETPAPAAKKQPAAKPKPAAKAKAPAAQPAERMDTASILAAARKSTKRGPVSKAESPGLDRGRSKVAKPGKPKLAAPKMPEKPAYAMLRPAKAKAKAKAKDEGGRRSFLSGMAVMGTTFGLWTLATARFMFPNVLTEPPSKFKVGFPSGFPPGQVETKFKAQFGVWVVNGEYEGRSEIYALSTVCTHLGCTPNWLDAEQKFKCPCHGSGFYKDGVNFEGPAPRPLERYAIRVADDGQVEIDKSKKFQEELGQWNESSSYIPT